MTSDQEDTSTLPSSRLGTQEYWESVYQREVRNFTSDGDRGEVWFGQEAAGTMLAYVRAKYRDRAGASSPTVLDVGSGNGQLLFSLCGVRDEDEDSEDDDEDEEGNVSPTHITAARNMCGIDYSPASIRLCQDIARAKSKDWPFEEQYSPEHIQWKQCDVLDQEQVREVSSGAGARGDGWDIVLDKGTLDAIALTPVDDVDDKAASPATPLERYIRALEPLTHAGGLLLITSCNFTSEELIAKLTARKAFTHIETLPAKRQFQFGGVKGSTTVCVAFRRVAE